MTTLQNLVPLKKKTLKSIQVCNFHQHQFTPINCGSRSHGSYSRSIGYFIYKFLLYSRRPWYTVSVYCSTCLLLPLYYEIKALNYVIYAYMTCLSLVRISQTFYSAFMSRISGTIIFCLLKKSKHLFLIFRSL